jgi:glycosyltransferase involved in cell wall biosynthesis
MAVRVAHIITRLDRGGSAENTLLTGAGLQARGYRVTILAGPATGPEASRAGAEAAGVRFVRVPALRRPIRPWHDARALWSLWRHLRRERYDLVHTHSAKAGILGRMAARLARAPVVVHTPHGSVYRGYGGRLASGAFVRLERGAAGLADRLIGLTPGEVAEHVAHGVGSRDRWVTIPSGIDLDRFRRPPAPAEARRALGVPLEAPVVGTVGRLEPVKGQRVLLDAVARLRGEECLVLVVGDGPERAAVEAQAARLGLGARARFLGWRPDVPLVLAAMDVFALPSENEGMGRALVEAMAAGLPAVASLIGGVPALVADGVTGLLVPPGDAGALARALERLLSDPPLRRRLGQAAREAVAGHDARQMVEQIDALYRELLAARGLAGGGRRPRRGMFPSEERGGGRCA